jgi:hypothetical protein
MTIIIPSQGAHAKDGWLDLKHNLVNESTGFCHPTFKATDASAVRPKAN